MQSPLGIINIETLAEGIQTVFLPRIFFSGNPQTIDNSAVVRDRSCVIMHKTHFVINKCDVKCSVVYYQLNSLYKLQEVRPYAGKTRFIHQKLTGDSVHLECTIINIPLMIDLLKKVSPGTSAIYYFDATYFQYSMSLFCFQSRRLCVKHHLTHNYLFPLI